MQPLHTFPATPMQHGMVFNALMHPERGIDTTQFVMDFYHELDFELFKMAWGQLSERHAVLRSAFEWQPDGSLRQAVYDACVLPIAESDWRGLSADAQAAQLRALVESDRRMPYDFEQAPLFRIYLMQIAPQHNRMLLSMHHSIVDGRMYVMMMQELFELYDALIEQRPPILPDRVPFARYAEWHAAQDWAEARPFWERQMRGISGPTRLGVDGLGIASDVDVTRSGKVEMRLSAEVTQKLRQLVQQYAITMTTIAQGAWSLLLHHYSGENDVVSGVIRACRYSAFEGSESIMGMLINTVPLCAHIDPSEPLIDWLETLRRDWMAMRAYEQTPLMEIQKWSNVPTNVGLFESAVVLEKAPLIESLRRIDSDWQEREIELHLRQDFPIAMYVWDDDPLMLSLTFDRDKYGEPVVEQLLAHYAQILSAIANAPMQPIGTVPRLTQLELTKLNAWNETARPYPSQHTIAQIFEQAVAATPQAPALAFDGQTLSYGEVNQRANLLAKKLIAQAVSAETLVAIYLQRSFDLIIAMLAITKAGAAYLPLDTNAPAERISYMLNDSSASLIITNNDWAEQLPPSQATHLVLATDWHQQQGDDANLPPKATADSLAYVMYTSGSTGQPKGVCVTQRGVARLVKNSNYMTFEPGDRFLQFGATAFDASTWEIWGALLNGATLYLYPPEPLDLEVLAAFIEHNQISSILLPSGLFHQMVDYRVDSLRSVRYLLAGGDVVSVAHAERVRQVLPDTTLINAYGPTENAVITTTYRVPPDEPLGTTLPIGHVIANSTVYILDDAMQRVPLGVVGSLYTGGDGVGRGYLDRPELTDERFIPDQFSSQGKLYATGDQARFRPNGVLEFHGRKDTQVKLRGFRIEMGEIEHALGLHQAVGAHTVIVREDALGEKMLIAYLVANGQEVPTADAMRRFVQESLPAYMTPRHFIWLDEMPLTHNGKVDRRALPEPNAVFDEPTESYIAPRSPIERVLATIWSDVLSVEQVGIHDDFFALGGHSLLATQAISRMRAALSVELPLRYLFEERTIAGMSSLLGDKDLVTESDQHAAVAIDNVVSKRGTTVSDATPSAETQPQVVIPRIARTKALELSSAQQRLWFLDRFVKNGNSYNIPFAIRMRGPLELPLLEQALTDVIARHEILRTTYHQVGEVPTGRIHSPLPVNLPVYNLDHADALEQYIEADARLAFDLETAVVRLQVVRLTQDHHVLLINVHHIALDGVSANIISKELATRYNGYRRGTSEPLPEQPIEYADYAAWQRKQLQGDRWQELATFWRAQLGTVPPALALPTDSLLAGDVVETGGIHRQPLEVGTAERLRLLCQQESVTLFALMLAVFQWQLSRYAGVSQIPVGMPFAGRERDEVASLVGFFVNTLVISAEIPPIGTFKTLLHQVATRLLDSVEHGDMPFEQLVKVLDKPRVAGRSPIFQTFFTAQGRMIDTVSFDGLETQQIERKKRAAKFELMLSIVEDGDELALVYDYQPNLFSAETIAIIAAQYDQLLRHIINQVETDLHAPNLLLTQSERRRISHANMQLAVEPNVQTWAIGPLRDAPQGASLAAWIVGELSDGFAERAAFVDFEIVTVDAIPQTNGTVDFGRLPRPISTPDPQQLPAQPVESLQARRKRLARRRKQLSAGQQHKLAQLVKKAGKAAASVGLPKRDTTVAIPLTFAQQRVWFLDQLTPANTSYNMPFRLTFYDRIDPDLLRASLAEMSDRHEILRTYFAQTDRGVEQVIAPRGSFEMQYDSAENDAELEQLSLADARELFDFTAKPLSRVTLVEHPQKQVLLLTFHHIVLDGWSWGVFLNELFQTYSGRLMGRSTPILPEPALQFGDYAVWQQQQDRRKTFAAQLAYWREQLAGVPRQLNLPYDRVPSAEKHQFGRNFIYQLKDNQLNRLRALADAQGVSLNMLLNAAYALLLRHYAKQHDFVLGSVIANRQIETEAMLGFFSNTLLLRMRLKDDDAFGQFVRQVRQTILDAFANQDVPYERVVAAMRPVRHATRAPMIQALLQVQNFPKANADMPIRIEQWAQRNRMSKFDLECYITEMGEVLHIEFMYSRDLFDVETIETLADNFGRLLRCLTSEMRLNDDAWFDSAESTRTAAQLAEIGTYYADASDQSYVAPSTELERQLACLWERSLQLPSVGTQTSFFCLGGHSMLAVQVMAATERLLGRKLPLAWLFEHDTISAFASKIEATANQAQLHTGVALATPESVN